MESLRDNFKSFLIVSEGNTFTVNCTLYTVNSISPDFG